MSTQKDIIGIVKELQEAEGSDYELKVVRRFPAIAQALIIAVEGLEWFEQCEAQLWGDSQEAKLKAEIINELALKPVNNKAKEILSRIRYLPTQ